MLRTLQHLKPPAIRPPPTPALSIAALHTSFPARTASKPSRPAAGQDSLQAGATTKVEEKKQKEHKTQAQLDQELMQKLAGMSDEGGAAGVEYEDGKAVSMKRGVKSNMFRYI